MLISDFSVMLKMQNLDDTVLQPVLPVKSSSEGPPTLGESFSVSAGFN